MYIYICINISTYIYIYIYISQLRALLKGDFGKGESVIGPMGGPRGVVDGPFGVPQGRFATPRFADPPLTIAMRPITNPPPGPPCPALPFFLGQVRPGPSRHDPARPGLASDRGGCDGGAVKRVQTWTITIYIEAKINRKMAPPTGLRIGLPGSLALRCAAFSKCCATQCRTPRETDCKASSGPIYFL